MGKEAISREMESQFQGKILLGGGDFLPQKICREDENRIWSDLSALNRFDCDSNRWRFAICDLEPKRCENDLEMDLGLTGPPKRSVGPLPHILLYFPIFGQSLAHPFGFLSRSLELP